MMQRPYTILVLALSLATSGLRAAEPAADPAVAAALAKINATGASLMPLSAEAEAYRFTALNVAKEFSDSGLEPFAPIADKITSLDLARTKVTDAGLKAVAAMKNLTELRLDGTGIGDAGLDHLTGLKSLEYLNLYNSKVTDAGVQKLAALPKLRALYLWQTGVTKAGAAQLRAKLPVGAQVNIGWTAEDDAKPVVAAAEPAAVAAATPAATAPAAAAKPAAPASTAAAPAAAAKLDAAVASKAVVYKDIVAPILAAKCVSCHGEEKKKGKLQLHDFAAIMKGGSEGPTTVVAGKAADSLLLTRINLPADDDEHMPPSDEPQVTKEELAVLKWWVESGASDTVTVVAAKPTGEVEAALAMLLSKGLAKEAAPSVAKMEKPKPQPLTEAEKKQIAEVAAKMQALNASLMPLAQDTEQVRLSVINAADKFGDAELALLEQIAKHVVWVDLARSKVTDAAGDVLAKMTNLQRLHLENTKVGDTAVEKLAGLRSLEYLNLYDTKVTDVGIAKLAGAKGLKKLFVWQTGVTRPAAKALEGQIPGLVVNVGLSEAEIAQLTATPPAPPPPAPTPVKKEEPKKDPTKTDPAKKDAAKSETKAAAARSADAPPAAKPAPTTAPAKADAPPAPKPAPTPVSAKSDAPPAAVKPPAPQSKPAPAPVAAGTALPAPKSGGPKGN